MKVLLIGYEPPDINKVRGWDTFCTYFLDKALREQKIDVINMHFKKDVPFTEIPNVDFIVCVTRMKYLMDCHGQKLIDELNKKSNNRICSFGDLGNNIDIGQISFNVLINEDSPQERQYKAWWCGDNDYLYPDKANDKFYILLDHIHYSSKRYDFIFDLYRKGLKEVSKHYPIDVKIIADPNVQDFDLKINKEYPFTRSKNKWLDIIPYYRKAHLYCVTHLELGGLSVMETGWAGASIIIPDSYICKKLASEVNSYCCNQQDYKNIRDSILLALSEWELNKNLEMARSHTWKDTIDKMVNIMREIKK